jgi:hypothetical protein
VEALAGLASTLEASALGVWARGSPYGYPLANLVHLLGLVLLIGGIGVVDLRLAGLFRGLPAAALARTLTPLAIAGLALMVVSGAVMFSADAKALLGSATFRWKLLLIAVALANAAAWRRLWRGRLATWDADPPRAGRAMAAASAGLWLGRLIAYS